MAMRVSWDQMFGRRTPDSDAPAPFLSGRWRVWLNAGEELLTFFLTYVALAAVVASIERANWVVEMPSLSNAAIVGLVSGWVLARTRVSGWLLHPPGIIAGVAVVLSMVLRSLRIAPGLPDGIRDRWEELYARNAAWGQALLKGDFSTDPLPFVLMVVFGAWLLAYLAAWSVARWRNPWLALVPGSIALLTNISYLPGQPAAELVIFLFAAILLFARVHLLRTIERWTTAPSEAAVTPSLLSLEVLNLATWVGIFLIVVAWMIPTANHRGPFASAWSWALTPVSQRVDRIGQLFIGVGSKQSLGLHRFESALPLQGSVGLGSAPLLGVSVGDDAPAVLYLRGAVYDQYTGYGWKQGSFTTRPLLGTTVETASFGTQQTRAQARQPVLGSIRLDEVPARRRLFSFGEPLAASVGARMVSGGAPEDLVGLEPATPMEKGDQYQTVGTVTAASIDRLLTSSTDYAPWMRDRYLQLLADLPPEVRALARQIAGEERIPYKLATKVEDYLRTNYVYSLEVGTRSQREDAVKYFLFDAKRGYSDYFASSMVVLLRAMNVPARVAVGFAMEVGERDPVTKEFKVTDQNSWVWPQVYFPGSGWVDFNPTPSRALIPRIGNPDDLATPEANALDLGLLPNDLLLEEEFIEPSASLGEEAGGELAGILAKAGTWLFVASLAVVSAFVVGRIVWTAMFRGLSDASQRWAKVQTLAGWAGVTVRRDRTPFEEAALLNTALARPPIDLAPLAHAYVVERYGGRAMTETEEEANQMAALYVDARSRLTRRLVRRFFGLGRR